MDLAGRALAALALAAAGGLGSCHLPSSEPSAVGTLSTTWMQEGTADTWLEAAFPPGSMPEVVTGADRQRVLDRLDEAQAPPGAGPHAFFEQLELDDDVLVVGGYHRCTEESRLVADPEVPGGVRFVVVDPEPDTECVWAPYTVDVWQVAPDEVGAPSPQDVILVPGEG